MTARVAMLRGGYVAFAVAFVALAGVVYAPVVFALPFLAALVAAVLLMLSRDDVPRWAGVALLAYFALTLLAFVASSGVTINKGGRYFLNDDPPAILSEIFYYLGFAFPVMLAGAALAAAWEREAGPRALLGAAIVAFLAWGVLSYVLVPRGTGSGLTGAATQGTILQGLAALAALLAAAGAAWAAARPDEYG